MTPHDLAEKIYFQGKWSGTSASTQTWSVAWLEKELTAFQGEVERSMLMTSIAEIAEARASALEEAAKVASDHSCCEGNYCNLEQIIHTLAERVK